MPNPESARRSDRRTKCRFVNRCFWGLVRRLHHHNYNHQAVPPAVGLFFSPSTPYLEREREKGLRGRRGVEIEQLGWWIHTWDTWHTETRRHHHHQVAKKPATKPPTINTRTYAEISSDFATLHLEGL